MKKTIIAIAMLALAFGAVGQADAVSLPIGGIVTPTGITASPGVGTALASLSVSFIGKDSLGNVWFTGTLNQWVRTNSLGYMVFEYEVINDLTSIASVKLTDITDFDSFKTNVDVFSSGVLPKEISRDYPGNSIGFAYNSLTGLITPGSSSGMLWVETNATSYMLNGTTQLQGTGNTRITTYSPAVPEPTTVALLGLGLVGFVGKMRRKFMA